MTISVRRCLMPAVLLTAMMSTVGSGREPALPKTVDLDLGGGVTMTMVLIPAGSFEMGSDKGADDEKPVHRVTISKPFYLGKYEVTQQQWQAVIRANPSHFKGAILPVEMVSWDDCQEFLKKLQAKSTELKFALPTEGQWEYACRAGSKTEYSFGDDASRLGGYAWHGANSDKTTHEVGGKEPNAWGLYDMHGNVGEWCADWYAPNYPTGAQKDPVGALRGSARVLRSGSWWVGGYYLRSAGRNRGNQGYRSDSYGFRVAAAP